MSSSVRAIAAVVGVLVFAPAVLAQGPVWWTGASSTDWFTASNWDTGTVPTAADFAILDTVTPSPTVIDGGDAAVRVTSDQCRPLQRG